MAMSRAAFTMLATALWPSFSIRPQLLSPGSVASANASQPVAKGQDRHSGLLALAEKLEADPSSAAALKGTIEPMLQELEEEMRRSHTNAQSEVAGLHATFTTCAESWDTQKGEVAVPSSSSHSSCRLGEAGAKQQYDACYSVQTTLEIAMDKACSSWEAARDKLASKDNQPEVMIGETHLAYMQRLQDFAAQELAAGVRLEKACTSARDIHASKVAECEGVDGNGALKKVWLDKQAECTIEQGLFETTSCSYTQHMESACAEHTRCFNGAMDVWKTETEAFKDDAESRKASSWMVKRIRCLISVFEKAGHHNDVDPAEVEKCKSTTHDQSEFDLPIPADPAQPGDCTVLPKPCLQDWIDAEYSNTSDAPLATCTPCGSAQKAFVVLSVDHRHGQDGEYFNFDVSQAESALGSSLVHGGFYRVTNLRSGWSGDVIIWTSPYGGSVGDGVGRKGTRTDPSDRSLKSPSDWQIGDVIKFEAVGEGNWVPLLGGVTYTGKAMSAATSTLNYGSFTAFRAVYRSGGVTCNSGYQSEYKWQMCNPHVPDAWSFELMKNNEYVVSQPLWRELPPECAAPSTPTGDIVCTVSFNLKAGDTLQAGWYEPSRQTSTGDNGGSITVDIYGIRA